MPWLLPDTLPGLPDPRLPPACTVRSPPPCGHVPAARFCNCIPNCQVHLLLTLQWVTDSPTHLYLQIKSCVSHLFRAQNVGVEPTLKSPAPGGDSSEWRNDPPRPAQLWRSGQHQEPGPLILRGTVNGVGVQRGLILQTIRVPLWGTRHDV